MASQYTDKQRERLAKLKQQFKETNERRANKKRAKRILVHNEIVVGAIAFKYSHQEFLDDQFIKDFEEFLKAQEKNGKFFSRAFTGKKRIEEPATTESSSDKKSE